jgi:hypothetical protein
MQHYKLVSLIPPWNIFRQYIYFELQKLIYFPISLVKLEKFDLGQLVLHFGTEGVYRCSFEPYLNNRTAKIEPMCSRIEYSHFSA